ncbi:MAG: Arginine--tRNA ligase [Phycisphaerae bacterium]|nr:Arginine--tRNA ligase [Phycisphaerae bacterium]
MQNIRQIISERVGQVLQSQWGVQLGENAAQVRPSGDTKFGDYQSNCAMGLARQLGLKPRDVAQAIMANLNIADICEPPEIAGPGFINFRLKPEYLTNALDRVPSIPHPPVELATGETLQDRLGMPKSTTRQIIPIDMSSPNLAKEMHVGHLRPTVIGDAVARILEFIGHQVHRLNHVGDWGTQFGMLVQYIRDIPDQWLTDKILGEDELISQLDSTGLDEASLADLIRNMIRTKESPVAVIKIQDLEEFYIRAKDKFDRDPEFAQRARQAVVRLQNHEPEILVTWLAFRSESLEHCHKIYEILTIENLIDRGESFYNEMLPGVVQELLEKGVAVESDGAICVFPSGFKGRDGEPLPLIIRKSDGGFGYATTDLAALKHRITVMHADRIIYVVGNQQKQHFEMLFAALKMIGWKKETDSPDNQIAQAKACGSLTETIHLATGMLLKEDGSPFKTREGGTVKLKDLLNEAVERCRAFLQANEANPEKQRGYSPEQIEHMAKVIGIAAVKYFELSHHYGTDYRFDWEEMLALEGNTAPYMLYAYARIQSILRKSANGGERTTNNERQTTVLTHPAELALAKQLLRFPEIIEQLGSELRPNLLTEYLYDLSKTFSTFYDRKTGVRVVDAENAVARQTRLLLCELTGRALKLGLSLLGIGTLDRM